MWPMVVRGAGDWRRSSTVLLCRHPFRLVKKSLPFIILGAPVVRGGERCGRNVLSKVAQNQHLLSHPFMLSP